MHTTRPAIRIRHGLHPDGEKTPSRLRPRSQICPLLAGLNRMGCRGPHCQWWVPYEDAETGDCAMVLVALGNGSALSDGLVSLLKEKQRATTDWNQQLRQVEAAPPRAAVPPSVVVRAAKPAPTDGDEPPGKGEAAAEPPESPRSAPPPADPPGEAPPEQPVVVRPVNPKLAGTVRGMSREQVQELWGEPEEVRDGDCDQCYVYRLPEGGRAYLVFEGDALVRVARW